MYDKWMILINHVWSTIFYWELTKQYLVDRPTDGFFVLTWHAVKDKMLMGTDHAVALCKNIATQIDIGPGGKKVLAQLLDLHGKGDLRNHSALDFDDCGVKVFRDKVLAHPLSKIKEILGKDPYKVSVKWETIEATIDKIREFCQAVEQHNLQDWNASNYLEGTGEGADGLKRILFYIEEAKKYDDLKFKIGKLGKPRVVRLEQQRFRRRERIVRRLQHFASLLAPLATAGSRSQPAFETRQDARSLLVTHVSHATSWKSVSQAAPNDKFDFLGRILLALAARRQFEINLRRGRPGNAADYLSVEENHGVAGFEQFQVGKVILLANVVAEPSQ